MFIIFQIIFFAIFILLILYEKFFIKKGVKITPILQKRDYLFDLYYHFYNICYILRDMEIEYAIRTIWIDLL